MIDRDIINNTMIENNCNALEIVRNGLVKT